MCWAFERHKNFTFHLHLTTKFPKPTSSTCCSPQCDYEINFRHWLAPCFSARALFSHKMACWAGRPCTLVVSGRFASSHPTIGKSLKMSLSRAHIHSWLSTHAHIRHTAYTLYARPCDSTTRHFWIYLFHFRSSPGVNRDTHNIHHLKTWISTTTSNFLWPALGSIWLQVRRGLWCTTKLSINNFLWAFQEQLLESWNTASCTLWIRSR